MKNLFVLLILCTTFSIQAQDANTFKTDAVEFIKLTGSSKTFDDAIEQIGAMVSEENKETYKKEALIKLDNLFLKIADLYMEEFTHSEIKELITFYKSDIGKKLASKQAVLAQKGMMMGKNWGIDVHSIAQKYK